MYNNIDYAGINSTPYPGGSNENFTTPIDTNNFTIPKSHLVMAAGLTKEDKKISDKEFVDWVESIAKVEDSDLRKKMSNALFLHLVSIFSRLR